MTTVNIETTTQAEQRIIAILALVQEQVPAADDDYVRKGAVGVGLNRLLDERFGFVAADFADPAASDDTIAVELIDGDEDRAESLATALSVDVALIYSAALVTGIGKLAGDRSRLLGPVE